MVVCLIVSQWVCLFVAVVLVLVVILFLLPFFSFGVQALSDVFGKEEAKPVMMKCVSTQIQTANRLKS